MMMEVGGSHPAVAEGIKTPEFGESEPKKPKLDDDVFGLEVQVQEVEMVSTLESGQVEDQSLAAVPDGYHKRRTRENSGEATTSDSGISNSNGNSACGPVPVVVPGCSSQLKSILKPVKNMTKRRRKFAIDPKTGESKIVKSAAAASAAASGATSTSATGEDFGTYIDYRGTDETEYYDECDSDGDESGDYGDDDDENDENNWRNEYPDEDKGRLHFWEDEDKDVCRLRSLQVGTGDDLSSDDDDDGPYDEPLYTFTADGDDEEGDGTDFSKTYSKYKARVSKQLGVSMNISNEVVSSPSESESDKE